MFSLQVATGSAAFEGRPELELARILRDVASTLERHGVCPYTVVIRDLNGNRVGEYGYPR